MSRFGWTDLGPLAIALILLAGPAEADPVLITGGDASLFSVGAQAPICLSASVSMGRTTQGRVFADEGGMDFTHGDVPPLTTGAQFDLSTRQTIWFAWAEPFGEQLHHWAGQFHFNSVAAQE